MNVPNVLYKWQMVRFMTLISPKIKGLSTVKALGCFSSVPPKRWLNIQLSEQPMSHVPMFLPVPQAEAQETASPKAHV